MVFRHISADMKHRILWLVANGYLPETVCSLFGVSERSLERWSNNYHKYGTAIRPRSHTQGRPRILNATVTNDLYDLVNEAPELVMDELEVFWASWQIFIYLR